MTDSTPHLGLPLLAAAQAQKHVTHNEALTLLDALVQLACLDKDLSAPPPSPSEGDRYLVTAANPGGAWAGLAGQVVRFSDGIWTGSVPRAGWFAYVADEADLYVFDGTAWTSFRRAITALQVTSRLGINTNPDGANRLAVKSDAALLSWDDVTPGSGDMRVTLNKQAAARDAALVFETGYAARALVGTLGGDDFSLKVSRDGTAFATALTASAATGGVDFASAEAMVAAAATTDLGAAGTRRVLVTGTATITSFGGSPNRERFVRFSGASILTHDAARLVLPTRANIVAAADDTCLATSDAAGNWRVRHYQRADGTALGPGGVTSVAGRSGAVTLSVADVSGAAPLASAVLTGTPTAPTAAAGTGNAQIATTGFVAAALTAAAPTTRQVATAGLATGGGDLSADRTIAVAKANAAMVAAGTDDASAVTPLALAAPLAAKVGSARQVAAGAGLTGGGDLSADRTLAIVAGGVANAHLAAAPAGTIKGNAGPAAGSPADLTPAQAKAVLGFASSGPNADITALSGLATPLSVAQGGTAATNAAAALSGLGGAPLASPAFTGVPTAPSAAPGTSTAQLATTAFVTASFVTYGYAAANYATAANATLTGTPTAPTQPVGDASTRIATTAYADRAAAAALARTQVNDAAYAAQPGDRLIAIIALTAPRTVTLPAAAAFPQGARLLVVDESGACSAANTITLARAGTSDAINGGTSVVVASAYGYVALESNGANKWTVVDAPAPVTAVAGRTGAVALAVADVAGAAPLASPALTGVPTAPNAAPGTSTAQLATTSFVAASFVTYGYAAANYATAANATLTGTPTAPTPAAKDNSTKLATTAYVDRAGAAAIARTQVNDSAYAILPTDRSVAVIALTAPRTLSLPAASAFPQGAVLTVFDESGACSSSSAITLAAAGADTINGAASALIAAAYGSLALESNTANKWTILAAKGATGAAAPCNDGVFGDGCDGDLNLASGTVTLTRDMFYRNLTISGSGSLALAAGTYFRLFVSGVLDLSAAPAGALLADGPAATTTQAGTTGAGTSRSNAASSAVFTGRGVGRSGGGGNGASAGGAGAPAVAATLPLHSGLMRLQDNQIPRQMSYNFGVPLQQPNAAGATGGGDGTNAGGAGGNAGTAGGMLVVYARTINRGPSTAASAIRSRGGGGANGGASMAGNTGGGGGGNGGPGGAVILLFKALTGSPAANAIDVSGGAGGNGGSGSGTGTAGTGADGSDAGHVTLIDLTAGTLTRSSGPLAGYGLFAGQAGGAGAAFQVGL